MCLCKYIYIYICDLSLFFIDDDSSGVSPSCPSPFPSFVCKPNPGIIQHFDSIIPYRHQTADGHIFFGQTIPPVRWEENRIFRTAAAHGAIFRDTEGELRVTIRSWIVSLPHALPMTFRDIVIRAQLLIEIEQRIRTTWADQIAPDDRIRLSTVRPSPAAVRGQRPLHMLIEVNRRDDSVLHPVLLAHREIDARGPSHMVIWRPTLLASPVSLDTFHTVCGPPCGVEQLLVPQPGRVRRWLQQGQTRPIHDGLFIPIWWDLRIRPLAEVAYEEDTSSFFQTALNPHPLQPVLRNQESHVFDRWCTFEDVGGAGKGVSLDADFIQVIDWTPQVSHQPAVPIETVDLCQDEFAITEEISFMQRPGPSQAPSVKQIYLIGLHKVLALTSINLDVPIFPQLEAAWPITSRSYEDLSAIHEVSAPPSTSVAPEAGMMLLEFSDDYFEQTHVNDVLIVVSIVQQEPQRKQRLRAMWAPRKITRHGVMAFLRVHWFCDQPDAICFLYQNNQEWAFEDNSIHNLDHGDHIRLQYRSSRYSWCDIEHSETIDRARKVFASSDEEEADQEVHQEVGSSQPSRSRSRSRQRHEADSHSLLQMSSKKRTRAVTPEEGGSEKDQPHVFDRWCAGSSSNSVSPQVITLEDKIGLPRHFVHIQCAEATQMRIQMSSFVLPPFLDRFCVDEWHSATSQAWHLTPNWDGEPPIGLRFYMDGSSHYDAERSERIGAAATILLVETEYGIRFGGIQGRSIPQPATSPLAESWALLQALLWAVSLLNQFGEVGPIGLFGDATGPGNFLRGEWTPVAHRPVVDACRDFMFWIQERTGFECQWHHVAAHTGHPWNEAADTVAKAIADGILPAPHCQDLWNEISHYSTVQWTWSWLWFLEKISGSSCASLKLCNQDLILQLPDNRACDPGALFVSNKIGHSHQPLLDSRVGCFRSLSLMTVNVLSLFAGTDEKIVAGNYVSARMEAIALQCRHRGLDIIGLQETRHRADHYFLFENFHVLSGPATAKRTGGTQLWIARDAFGLRIDKSHLRTFVATDRILVAALRHPQLHIGLVVLHAPSSGQQDELRQWWSEVDQHLRPLHSLPVFVLMDANSRVGSITSQSIGDCHPVQENIGGHELHHWLMRHDLWLPSTFPHCHQGSSDTWQHATGTRSRIDYIATSSQFKDQQITTWVEDAIDVELQRPDHFPLRMDIQLWKPDEWSQVPRQPSQAQPSVAQFHAADCQWDLDVNTHANLLETELREGQLQAHAALRRRKTHLSEATWTLILAKKACYKQLRRIRRHRDLGFLRTIFGRWRRQQSCQPALELSFQPWVRWTWKEEARVTFLYYKFAKATTPAVRQDDVNFYNDLARRAGETDSIGGLKLLWKELKATLPKSLNRKKLNPATQQPDSHQMYAHFDQLEAGEPKTFELLVEQCVQQQTSLRRQNGTSLSLREFPSRLELERLCGKVKLGKAPGLDAIAPSQVRRNSTVVGQDLFYLMFKMWASAEEPASWKGGMLWPLWKGKGPKHSAASYRGIVLLPVLGKRWHALLRSRVLPHALQHRPPMQFGGFPGQQPGFASFIARGFSARAKMHRLSDACIFLDLRAAFHHLIRHLAMDMGNEDLPEALASALRHDGFSTEAVQQHRARYERIDPCQNTSVDLQLTYIDLHGIPLLAPIKFPIPIEEPGQVRPSLTWDSMRIWDRSCLVFSRCCWKIVSWKRQLPLQDFPLL